MSSKTEEPSKGAIAFMRWVKVLLIIGFIGWSASAVYQNTVNQDAEHPFKLGLDLAGGSHLVYVADTSEVDSFEVAELMNTLRDVIERRVNMFGVSEPIVQVESSSFVAENKTERLVVELPGVTDVSAAVEEIGRTPLLEFKLFDSALAEELIAAESLGSLSGVATSSGAVIGNVKINGEEVTANEDTPELPFVDTGLTGRYLETATLEFAGVNSGQLANEPTVVVRFTDEGSDLFADITRSNIGEKLGIFLDGEMLSAPVINEAITGGSAIISGNFTQEEAKQLVKDLKFGALPLPIKLESTQTVGASLGSEVLEHGIDAGILGLILIISFMLVWYRLSGLVAGVSLVSYVTLMLLLFQMVPVTLTAAGLAGFVLSLGMAVDANVLVFERMKEEFNSGLSSRKAAKEGFRRAWSAIRDGNITSLLSAIILFWFGTSMVKGFALVFGMGIVVSMLSALVITRTLIMALPDVKKESGGFLSILLGNGLNK